MFLLNFYDFNNATCAKISLLCHSESAHPFVIGIAGEYVGGMLMMINKTPQFVIQGIVKK